MSDGEPHQQDHQDIWAWRFAQFQELGFSLAVADDLANTNIEIWAARRLVQSGCSLSLVQRILRGTTPFGEDFTDYLRPNPAISSPSEHLANSATT